MSWLRIVVWPYSKPSHGQRRNRTGLPYDENALVNVAPATQTGGLEILRVKGATYYGIGAALVRIVSGILCDENAVLTVSSLAPASMGIGEVPLSLLAIVNRSGVARVLPIPLSQAERQALRHRRRS